MWLPLQTSDRKIVDCHIVSIHSLFSPIHTITVTTHTQNSIDWHSILHPPKKYCSTKLYCYISDILTYRLLSRWCLPRTRWRSSRTWPTSSGSTLSRWPRPATLVTPPPAPPWRRSCLWVSLLLHHMLSETEYYDKIWKWKCPGLVLPCDEILCVWAQEPKQRQVSVSQWEGSAIWVYHRD